MAAAHVSLPALPRPDSLNKIVSGERLFELKSTARLSVFQSVSPFLTLLNRWDILFLNPLGRGAYSLHVDWADVGLVL